MIDDEDPGPLLGSRGVEWWEDDPVRSARYQRQDESFERWQVAQLERRIPPYSSLRRVVMSYSIRNRTIRKAVVLVGLTVGGVALTAYIAAYSIAAGWWLGK